MILNADAVLDAFLRLLRLSVRTTSHRQRGWLPGGRPEPRRVLEKGEGMTESHRSSIWLTGLEGPPAPGSAAARPRSCRSNSLLRLRHLTMPCLDDAHEQVEKAYGGYPALLVVVRPDGRVALKARSDFRFPPLWYPEAVRARLDRLLEGKETEPGAATGQSR